MDCPSCGKPNTRVTDSRPGKIEFEIRRRRQCKECSRRFTTYEKFVKVPVMIIKKDGRREDFNRGKILIGMKKACEKRSISINLIEEIVDSIEQYLRQINKREIPSKIVGEKIIEALKKIDDVAYVRFASVYRDFKNLADFIQELKELLPKECLPIEFNTISDKADDPS